MHASFENEKQFLRNMLLAIHLEKVNKDMRGFPSRLISAFVDHRLEWLCSQLYSLLLLHPVHVVGPDDISAVVSSAEYKYEYIRELSRKRNVLYFFDLK